MDYTVENLTITKDNKYLLNELYKFPNLKNLECFLLFTLTEIDLSQVPNLQLLNCSYNKIEKLDLSQVPNLQVLNCNHNELNDVDFSTSFNLKFLECAYNKMKDVDFSQLTNLQHLNCSFNDLTQINLPANLQSLDCSDNQLSGLDLSQVPNLQLLYCSYNQLSELDLSYVPNLQHLSFNDNQVSQIDLLFTPTLKHLNCSFNQLKELDLSYVPDLEVLICSENQLSQLDLSQVPFLQELICNDNQLTQLDLSYTTNLLYVTCDHNLLTDLDVSHLPNLINLSIDTNQITRLQISNQQLRNLEYFSYINNPLQLPADQVYIINNRPQISNKNIVENKQSVHEEEITKGVIKSFDNLRNYPPMQDVLIRINEDSNIPDEVKTLVNKYSQTADKHSVLKLNYEEALALVYPHHTVGSIAAFNQEVLSSVEHGKDVCLTGKITRLANSLNGFIENVKITISDKQEIGIKAAMINNDASIKEEDKLEAFMELVRKNGYDKIPGIDISHWSMQFEIEPEK